MRDILCTLKMILVKMLEGAGRVSKPVPELAKKYLRGLLLLAILSTLFPVPFAITGIASGWLWLTACAGLWCSVFLAILFAWGAPIGILLDTFLEGKRGEWISGKRYISAVRGALLWEALTYWTLSIVPLRNRWELVPLCALSVLCLVLMTYHWQRNGGWAKLIFWYGAMALTVIITTSFFLPKLTLSDIWKWLDSSIWKESNALVIGIIAGVAVVICIALSKKSRQEQIYNNTAEEKSGLGALVLLLALLVIGGIASADAIRSGRWSNFRQTAVVSNQLEPEGGWFRKMAPVNGWRVIHVGRGITMRCVVDHPTAHIWSRYNNEPAHEDWRDQELVPPPRVTPYDFYIKSAGADPVPVKIYLTQ